MAAASRQPTRRPRLPSRRAGPVLKDRTPSAFGMFYLAVDDFDSYVATIRPLVNAIKEGTHNGQTLFYFTDPDGYIIGVVQKQEW
ncbi:VOC family protein [Streptomyces sp. NPDC088560]|uniref:VOC family protein n=1 Tax=Streptomyces sp. NPDC088560 TaxID=3365868 RepID=UPI003804E16E